MGDLAGTFSVGSGLVVIPQTGSKKPGVTVRLAPPDVGGGIDHPLMIAMG